MKTYSTSRLDRILRDIPDHRRRSAPAGARARDVQPAPTRAAVDAANHPPVGGLKSLSDYQRILDEHYERERQQATRPPVRGDHLAGLRDVALDRRFAP
jgi:hypothetical protein